MWKAAQWHSPAGADPLWGRRVVAAMQRAGLVELTAETYAESWWGGGVGVDLHRVNVDHVGDRLTGVGVTRDEQDRFRALLDDPAFAVNSYPMVSVRGQRP